MGVVADEWEPLYRRGIFDATAEAEPDAGTFNLLSARGIAEAKLSLVNGGVVARFAGLCLHES
jgi:hypothetical protein